MENNINDLVYKSEPQDPLDVSEIKYEDDDSDNIIELQNADIFDQSNVLQTDYIILNTVNPGTDPCLSYSKDNMNININNNSNDSINSDKNQSLNSNDIKNQNAPKKRDEIKRMTHNEVERRRRDKINNWLLKLKELVPSEELNDNLLVQMVSHDNIKKNNKKLTKSNSSNNSKNDSKCGVIQRACDYIREMQTELNELKECLTENKSLKIENRVLKKENQILRNQLNEST